MEIKDLDAFLETEDGKKWFNSKIDSETGKRVQSFRQKFEKEELPKLVESELSKRHPQMTDEQKRIKELELKAEQMEKKSRRSDLTTQLTRYAQTKNIPQFLVDYSVSDDLDTSLETLNKHYKTYNDALISEVEKRTEPRKNPIRQYDDSAPIDLNNLPADDPEFYKKNFDRIEEMLKKNSN